jgi:MarR family transcriptional repressor of emrRAB
VVAINGAGRAKVRDTVPRIAGPLEVAFSGLTDPEMRLLDGLLRKMIVSFDTNARTVRSAA